MRKINVKVHPAANLFPWMDDEAFANLVEDIRVNGQAEPVLFYKGMLLDGRNRWAACEQLGIDCNDWEVDPETVTDPYAYVISMNLHRRHLTESQRSMVAARMATLKRGGDRKSDNFKGPNGPLNGTATIEDAAKSLSVGRNSVKRAKNVIDKGCKAVVDAVDQNKVPVSLASKLVDEVDDKKEQARLVKEGKKAIRDYITPPPDTVEPDLEPEPQDDESSPLWDAWEACKERLSSLKEIIDDLEPHEIAVVRAWIGDE